MNVRVIKTKKGHSLIEWITEDGAMQRAYVPADKVKDGECEHPERGVPYGLDFAALIGAVEVDVQAIAKELRNSGLWTAEDVQKNAHLAHGAIQRALSPVYATLMNNLKGVQHASEIE